MFRRRILEKIGYFDEQLLSGADFDFAMRLGSYGHGKHIDYNLGYYLNDRSGLSTKANSLQEIERTVVEIRYGLDPINKSLIEKAKKDYEI
jgi:GT2 family glycosyltransferase